MEAIFALRHKMNGSSFLPTLNLPLFSRHQRPTLAAVADVLGPSPSTVESASPALGYTLPWLLDGGCVHVPNQQALNQWHHHQWRSLSNQQLRRDGEEIALGLQALGAQRGDRIPLVMPNSLDFCRVDWGCLLAGLVDVPIDLTQTIENILFILNQTQAQILVIANLELWDQLVPYLWEAPALAHIVVAEVPDDWPTVRATLTPPVTQEETHPLPQPWACLHIPQLLGDESPAATSDHAVPSCLQLWSLAEVQTQGQQQWREEVVAELRAAIAPQDLATIIYIAGETQRPKGVMLTHENITANVLAAFASYPNLQWGTAETALLFLPLTHIFARVFLYGHLLYGHTVYLSDPHHLIKHRGRYAPR